ncbi:MAG TPA: PilZ domain-containing protein [Desulfobacterales bacterium]|nr:PilZ domain-containing protein [Desulfobacterales bacterium]
MEQRQYFRAFSPNTEVHISDRAGFCTGILKDFSRFGICITDIPRKIHLKDGCFTIVLSNENMNFKLKVVERWRTKEGLSTKVGVAIEDVPWDWTEMVMGYEPKNKDAWTTH